MKLAAMEGLNEGGKGVGLTVVGILSADPSLPSPRMKTVEYGFTLPKLLSLMSYRDTEALCPVSGILWTSILPRKVVRIPLLNNEWPTAGKR